MVWNNRGAHGPCPNPFTSSLNAVPCNTQSAKDALPNPDFIIVTGDYTRHDTQLLADPEATVLEVCSRTFSSPFHLPGVVGVDVLFS